MSSSQAPHLIPVRTVITPDVGRLAFDKIYRLYLVRLEKRNQKVPHGGDAFGVVQENRSLCASCKLPCQRNCPPDEATAAGPSPTLP